MQDIDQTMLEYLQYLHPYIKQGCTSLFVSGHYTQAVEESVKAVFSCIREKAGKSIDGTTLVEQVFSLKNPLLQFNDLSDQTKQNEQLGFMEGNESDAIGPSSLAVSDDGRVLVLDEAKRRIAVFHDGAFEREIPLPSPTASDLVLLSDL